MTIQNRISLDYLIFAQLNIGGKTWGGENYDQDDRTDAHASMLQHMFDHIFFGIVYVYMYIDRHVSCMRMSTYIYAYIHAYMR